MSRTFDADGNFIDGENHLGSIGARYWEMTHPGQVQQEQIITGNGDPQSQAEIVARSAGYLFNPFETYPDAFRSVGERADAAVNAAGQAYDALANAAREAADAATTAGKWIIIGVVALAVLETMKKRH